MASKLSKIRKRTSYGFWYEIFIQKKKRDIVDSLLGIYKILDNDNMFGSITNSVYSRESLIQLLIDRGYGNEVLALEIADNLKQETRIHE